MSRDLNGWITLALGAAAALVAAFSFHALRVALAVVVLTVLALFAGVVLRMFK
jgi:hypothetical protein